ncbi:hypothetical protein SAMN05720487_10741 [Fibrobacter sp. UWT2]|uniref:hypothetical protein n=1 Tax=Fibrobacter sp. UWT2 TaxID=1896224 RepID=UPI000919A532|nr:hypothetical protein [Fibrobacter sp. UWT2]SHL03625.1 hypothetical protein SAMN05720487_10741 [Fibrobacter sp. UWT2]
MSSPSAIVAKIRQEAALFDSKDRLLCFSTKNDLQSPLITEAGDLFYEKWLQAHGPLPLESFFQVSQNFTAQQKITALDSITAVLRHKLDDYGETDLYLLLGFLKWDGNALAPSLLVPLDFDPTKNTVSISARQPIENVILRERLKDSIALPSAEDAIINGKFSLLLYFSQFEKAIAGERNWRFTRHGVCLGFFNSNLLNLKKRYDLGFSEKAIAGNPILNSLLHEDGFQTQESLFEEKDFDKVFSPADHHFLYTTDSHTNKVTVDAENESACAYAIQALPGTEKMKVAANIVADQVAQGKKVLVVHKRAVSKRNFHNAWRPPFRSFPDSNRSELEQKIRTMRNNFLEYYDAVNKPIPPTNVVLADLLREFKDVRPPKKKFPDRIFRGINQLDFNGYQELKKDIQTLSELYFDKEGVNARRAFQGVKVASLSPEQQQVLAEELRCAADRARELEPVIKKMESTGLFPTGMFLSGMVDILELLRDNFDENTPTFEDWQLRSHNWHAYKDTLTHLPEAGDQWVRYRRQTSDIYTDNAVDENIQNARDDFAECQNISLKGLSERYRSSRKRLLQVIRKPKTVDSDAKLLDLIDTLLELQANKKSYKESAVLGNHLLGRDWHFEGSNWVELNQKIQYIYEFRDQHKDDPKLDLLLQLLEQWHNFKELQPELSNLWNSVIELQTSIKQINKDMQLETPLESLSIDKWLGQIQSWSDNWNHFDIHLQLAAHFQKMESYCGMALVEYLKDPDNADADFSNALAHYWTGAQIQAATKACPSLFSESPKAKAQKSKEYRTLLDQFSGANFKELHNAVDNDPSVLTEVSLADALRISDKQSFDITIILDADAISLAEATPILLAAPKTILVGDPHNPSHEYLPIDAFHEESVARNPFFQESILTAALRQGAPTRELWFSAQYSDPAIVSFANERIYNNGIKQLPPANNDIFKGISIKEVPDKIEAIALTAIRHAERHPEKTLGIIAFHQSTCQEIEDSIRAKLIAGTAAAAFFARPNADIRYFVKTPERAVDQFRDTILVCIEAEGASGLAADHKVTVCSTLAKRELRAFTTELDLSKIASQKNSLFREWINFMQSRQYDPVVDIEPAESPLRNEVIQVLKDANIVVQEYSCKGGIPVGPVVVDANNPTHFLSLIEDDCTTERFRDSIEDRDYVRPLILKQFGWKVMNVWLPFWFMSNQDEVGHLIATIAIEQSVAPPPTTEPDEDDGSDVFDAASKPMTEPYVVQHPKIEGTAHDKPIAELPIAALITQLKFYVDSEAPIHEEILKQRVLELHHVDRAGPVLQQVLTEAIHQGLQKKRFIKTGPFYYSLKAKDLVARNRSNRPDFERKLAYVAPEERALMPQSMDEHALKQAMGLLE